MDRRSFVRRLGASLLGGSLALVSFKEMNAATENLGRYCVNKVPCYKCDDGVCHQWYTLYRRCDGGSCYTYRVYDSTQPCGYCRYAA